MTKDNKRFLCQAGGKLFVFDIETGDLIFKDRVFSNGASVFALGVSPDGRFAFAGGSGVTSGVGGAPVPRPQPTISLPPAAAIQESVTITGVSIRHGGA